MAAAICSITRPCSKISTNSLLPISKPGYNNTILPNISTMLKCQCSLSTVPTTATSTSTATKKHTNPLKTDNCVLSCDYTTVTTTAGKAGKYLLSSTAI